MITYKVIDREFIIQYSLEGCRTFKVFLNAELLWQSSISNFLIPHELVGVVGFVIDTNISTLNGYW